MILSFPDFPGCGAAGATIGGARINAAHFLADHLQNLITAGEIPSSSSLLEIVSDPQWQVEGVDAIILAVRPIARMKGPEAGYTLNPRKIQQARAGRGSCLFPER